MPNIGEAFPRPFAQAERIAADPAYGEVVCFCERVTLGEIRDAAASPIPPTDLDGLRRRTRVLMGRCQGFFCGARVARRARATGAADMSAGRVDVAVIGAGPAGLAAATALRRAGAGTVVVLDREAQPGGVPRHCHHQGYGLRDLRRVLSGPQYAARWARTAAGAGRRSAAPHAGHRLDGGRGTRGHRPAGRGELQATAVVLATGCRERPRSAHDWSPARVRRAS